MVGCALGLYLYLVAWLGVGVGGATLFIALFVSYWSLLFIFWPVAYGIYALIAYKRKRKLGLQLIKWHYAIAVCISLWGFIFRDNEVEKTFKEVHAMADQPLATVFIFGPFLLANAWYLWRLLSTPIERVDQKVK